ncbi:MAG: hypothetical protein AAB262_05720, partial [Elusimicrobiota bacterium]
MTVRAWTRLPVLLVLVCPAVARAQQTGAGAFLRQDSSARAAAMAGAVTAVSDDASSLLINPAGLARLTKLEISATRVI